VERRLFRIRLSDAPWDPERIAAIREEVATTQGIPVPDTARFVLTGSIVNNAYDPGEDRIDLLYKDGSLRDIAEASDNLGIQALAGPVTKWYLTWPRWVEV
ncbi:MAG: hypothetical protein KDB95_12375, partial [Flavobacteriales bacterium]|nr:hypothetical protein [Flavobacteriales bacterium]